MIASRQTDMGFEKCFNRIILYLT